MASPKKILISSSFGVFNILESDYFHMDNTFSKGLVEKIHPKNKSELEI